MAAYYALGILLVVWALGLSAAGLTRTDFPPSGPAGRLIVGGTAVIVAGTLVALLLSTHKEHPRREAAAKAAEAKQATAETGAAPAGGAKTVEVTEKEFSIALAGGNDLKAGSYTFKVSNGGKIQHDLTVEGGAVKEAKTPLIDPGKEKDLTVDLKPGKYTFYCSVPGHEQSGMKVDVTVSGGKPAPQAPKTKAKKPSSAPKVAAAKPLEVTEKEFSIALAGGGQLKAGNYKFQVSNAGQIQHDLAVEGAPIKETKTPLIDAGKEKDLTVDLKPGKYKLFCTVPGHEAAGMKTDLTVK
jgi:uncharacterized cupredoxin-like copper-binding protein